MTHPVTEHELLPVGYRFNALGFGDCEITGYTEPSWVSVIRNEPAPPEYIVRCGDDLKRLMTHEFVTDGYNKPDHAL